MIAMPRHWMPKRIMFLEKETITLVEHQRRGTALYAFQGEALSVLMPVYEDRGSHQAWLCACMEHFQNDCHVCHATDN